MGTMPAGIFRKSDTSLLRPAFQTIAKFARSNVTEQFPHRLAISSFHGTFFFFGWR
jgi:hypothetical protein